MVSVQILFCHDCTSQIPQGGGWRSDGGYWYHDQCPVRVQIEEEAELDFAFCPECRYIMERSEAYFRCPSCKCVVHARDIGSGSFTS